MSGQVPPYQQQYGGQQPPYGQQQQQFNQTQNDSQVLMSSEFAPSKMFNFKFEVTREGVGQLGQNPGLQQQQPKLTLSPEEKAVMKECTDESFWYRSLPLSVALMGTAHLLVERGILKPSLRYGSKPKVAIASFLGYFFGKFSYAEACANKFLSKAPRSEISDAIRARRGLPALEPEPSNGPDYSGLGVPQQESSPLQYGYQPEQGVPGSPQPPSTNNYEDLRRRNREMSQVPNDGYRSSMPQVGQGVEGQSGSAYDDLRRRNRESNQQPESQPYPRPPAPLQPQQPGGYQPQKQGQGESKYGDDGFE